jgi:cytochrome c heme-lyase
MINESNIPLRSQVSDLNDAREASSIPIADPHSQPAHQSATGNPSEGDKNWVYPSEQMFFNAMKRKV